MQILLSRLDRRLERRCIDSTVINSHVRVLYTYVHYEGAAPCRRENRITHQIGNFE